MRRGTVARLESAPLTGPPATRTELLAVRNRRTNLRGRDPSPCRRRGKLSSLCPHSKGRRLHPYPWPSELISAALLEEPLGLRLESRCPRRAPGRSRKESRTDPGSRAGNPYCQGEREAPGCRGSVTGRHGAAPLPGSPATVK